MFLCMHLIWTFLGINEMFKISKYVKERSDNNGLSFFNEFQVLFSGVSASKVLIFNKNSFKFKVIIKMSGNRMLERHTRI